MGRYSHSKLSTFEQCPLRFKYRYIDKIIPEIEKSIEVHLGTSVHTALEWIYSEVKDNQKVPTLDEVIVYYSEAWQKDFSDKLVIVKKALTAKDYFNKGVEFLINYYTKYTPFSDGTLELEKKIQIKLNEHNITGFIDRVVKNIETGEYEIHDYKTANSLPTQEKIDQDRQLALYSIAIKEEVGQDKNVILVWHYLAHNQKIISKRTNEQLEQLKEETLALIKKIEETTEFPAIKGILCDWCEYKPTCKAHKIQKTINDQPSKVDLEKYPTISKYIKS